MDPKFRKCPILLRNFGPMSGSSSVYQLRHSKGLHRRKARETFAAYPSRARSGGVTGNRPGRFVRRTESIVKRGLHATDSASSNMLGLSANPTPPYYHRHPQFRRLRMSIAGGFSGPAAVHLIAGAASLRLRHHLCCLISSSLQSLKDIWYQRALSFNGVEYLQLSKDAFSFSCSSFFHFPDGREGKTDGTSSSETSRRKSSNGRHWTNVILAINILVYAVQLATQGKLLSWGAKINHLIDKGQWWRLATSSLLHANAMHLMVNCYSLNSIGPTVEAISGPKKYLMVYATSAITSSAMSYWLNKASSVGASGAIFGLVGYMAVYITRHRALIKDANEGLKHIAKVIILNTVIGLSSKGIDNWGHVGGFLGGVVTPWLLDPAWKLERGSGHGRRTITDIKGRKDPRQPK